MPSHKLGHWTASTISPILTGKGDSLLVGGVTYAKKIAMERSGIVELDPNQYGFQGNKATEWGLEHESDAIARYETDQFVTVHSQQVGIGSGYTTATPDGMIADDGILEVKCPYTHEKHWSYLADPDELKADYFDQVQFQLMLSGRKYCDLISYHPHYTQPFDLVIVRITPDTDWQTRCRNRIEQAEQVIREELKRVVG
jgi:hypothetical protein